MLCGRTRGFRNWSRKLEFRDSAFRQSLLVNLERTREAAVFSPVFWEEYRFFYRQFAGASQLIKQRPHDGFIVFHPRLLDAGAGLDR